MTRRRSDRDAGMTLVELLVVLTAGLHTASSGWQRIASRNADREEREALHSLLRGVLSEIYPAKFSSASQIFVEFDGQGDHIDFLAPLRQRFGAQDIVPYTLRFALDGSLHLSWRLDRPGIAATDDLVPPAADESIGGCQDGSFSYYGQIDEAGALRWWNSWQGQNKLPRLVGIRFTCRGHAEELVVAPLVTGAFCSVSSPDATCLN
jgi:type II secretory pathway pseudopilin PulG